MKLLLKPSNLSGSIHAIPSKSDAHRLLIASMLSGKKTTIHLPTSSVDIDATIGCINALGAATERLGENLIIERKGFSEGAVLDCHESGSTLRFTVPVASAVCETVSFTGSGRLPSRPIKELLDALTANGAEFSSEHLPFTKTGRLRSGIFALPGNVSSQYITGLLFALPLLEGDSEIRLTSRLESSAYIDITLWALKRFGIHIVQKDNSYFISGGQRYISPTSLTVDGDWSNSSYFLSAGATVTGLDINSPQGDKGILQVFEKMGGKISYNNGVCAELTNLSGCEIDISEIPDTFPTLAVLSTKAHGKTTFINGARLRIKESDRIEATASMLKALGINAEVHPDGMTVYGGQLHGGVVDGAGDHRIVMAAALASTMADGDITINGADAVSKSYPSFFEDYKKLGGKCYVI